MSLVVPILSTDNEAIPLGTVVVLDDGKVRAFTGGDSTSDTFGVIVPKSNNIVEYSVQSPYFYDISNPNGFNAYFEYTFEGGGGNTSNPNYNGSYDWTTDDACQGVMVAGIASILNTNSSYIKTTWRQLTTDSVTSVYLLC